MPKRRSSKQESLSHPTVEAKLAAPFEEHAHNGLASRGQVRRVSLLLGAATRGLCDFWGWCRQHPIAVFGAVSFLWVALLYGRALAGPFVYDDVLGIQQNPDLASWHGIGKYFRASVPLSEEYRGFAGSFYRPVFWLSLFLDRSIWGLNPAGFHATNLLLHWANGLLGFLLLRKLRVDEATAAATCLIWLGLPIGSEVVAWISGRPASLVVFFFLLGSLAALNWLNDKKPIWLFAFEEPAHNGLAGRGQVRRVPLLFGAATRGLCAFMVALASALLSNEWGIVALPLTLFLLFVQSRRVGPKLLTMLGAGSAVVAACLVARNASGAQLPVGPLAIFPVGLSLLKYIQWMILPLGLSIERSSETPPNVVSTTALVALFAAVAIITAVFLIRNKVPRVAAGVAWVLIAITPFCGVVFIYQGMAERYTYLASAGLVFAIVSAAWQIPRRFRTLAISILVSWVIWGAWRLNARVNDYQDETALFRRSLAASPRSAVLLYNLGVASAEAGDLDAAVDYYRRALAINPRYASAMINLGSLLHRQGKDADSAAYLRQAVQLAPQSPEPWVDLGNIYLQEGSLTEAKEAYAKALVIDPNNLAATVNYGAALQSAKDFIGAENQYRRAIEINPQRADGYTNLGAVLLSEGDTTAALESFKKAIAVDPRYPAAYFDSGVLYEHTGQRDLAVQMYAKALELQPEYPKARARLEALKTSR